MEKSFQTDEVDKAIESGIEFLLSNQKDNGLSMIVGTPQRLLHYH